MQTLRQSWMKLWFEPASPTNLAVCRILIFAMFLIRYLVLPIKAGSFAEKSAAFWNPVPLLGHFMLPILPGQWLRIFEVIWLCALGLASIGLFTRLSTALGFIFGFYLLWIPHNFGKLHHTDMVTILVLGVMMFSRCGDAFSLDRLIRKFRNRNIAPLASPAPSGEYTWPIRMVWLIMTTIFFAAGVAKLRHSGLQWVFSDNMAVMLIKVNFLAYIDYPPLLPWGLFLARYLWVCQGLAAMVLMTEISYPLVLFSQRARRILAPGMFFILLGSTLVFLPSFVELLACHIFYVPWGRVGRWCKAVSSLGSFTKIKRNQQSSM
jgi:hypothetical protein